MDMTRIERLRQKANDLPLSSGVYLMKNQKNQIIYVGKAKKLKNRVTSYFRGVEHHTPKVFQMVSQVADFDTILTANEFEALVLECSLIKQHAPKYNIKLKDAQGYSYIRISDEAYPRITLEKSKAEPGRYLGPYMSYSAAREAVDLANRVFGLPTCTRVFPRDFGKQRPCLNAHIGQCCGLCTGKVPKEDYAESLRAAVKFLQGNTGELKKDLEKQMQAASEELAFEKAARLRDQLRGLAQIKEKQSVLYDTEKEADVLALAEGDGIWCASTLVLRQGRLTDKRDFLFEAEGEPEEVFGDFLSRYYYTKSDIPRRIYLNRPAKDLLLLADLLTKQQGRQVQFFLPDSGSNAQLVRLAGENAREALGQRAGRNQREYDLLVELAKLLGLSQPPKRIESYDISNMGSSEMVAGMVVFQDGIPEKRSYKRFIIKDQLLQDDYAAMQQVLTRRLTRFKQQDPGFEQAPDLILLDGGEGHVAVGKRVLADLGLEIPLFGMVKNSKHRTRAISAGGSEIDIKADRQVFALITRVQDEVHRYSVAYLHKRRAQNSLKTQLTQIPGIGKAKADRLLLCFKSVARVAAATDEQILNLPGFGQKDLQAIRAYFSEHPAQ